jgi:hypothetical protein
MYLQASLAFGAWHVEIVKIYLHCHEHEDTGDCLIATAGFLPRDILIESADSKASIMVDLEAIVCNSRIVLA